MSTKTDECICLAQAILNQRTDGSPFYTEEPEKLWNILTAKPKAKEKGVTAMPDSVRKALGLPSNSEDNAGLKYRKLKESA